MALKDFDDSVLDQHIKIANESLNTREAEALATRKWLDSLTAEKARREAEAKKTVGRRWAEDLIRPIGGYHIDISSADPRNCCRFAVADAAFRDGAMSTARDAVAAAIDKVRADTIEECAKVLDREYIQLDPGGVMINKSNAARNIRALK